MNSWTMTMRVVLIFWGLVLSAGTSPAQHSLSSGLLEVSRQLAQARLPDNARLAVLDFRDMNGNQSLVGRYLAEELTTHLIQTRRFDVVERSRFDSILEELRRGDDEQQIVNPEFAEKFRGLSGADYVVIGSLFRARDHVALNARLIGLIETPVGKVHAAAIVRFRLGPDGNIDSSLSGGRTQSAGNTVVTLLKCRKLPKEILCLLNITWSGARGRMAVLPSSTAVQGNRKLTLRSLTIRDVMAPAGVNATSSVKQGDTVPATVRFAAAGNGDVITRLTIDLRMSDSS